MTPTSSSPTLDDLAAINAEIAALVRAQIPLEPELRRLGKQWRGGAGKLADRLAQRLEQGSDLPAAIEAEGNNLPEVYRAVVAAGLRGGDLPSALTMLANSSRRLADIRLTTASALVYPTSVAIVASLLLALVVFGVFTNVAWIDRAKLGWLENLAGNPWVYLMLLVIVPAVAIVGPLVWWGQSRRARSIIAARTWLLGWIPGARKTQRLGAAATLAEVLRTLTTAGVPLDRALDLAGRATCDRQYRRAALALAECGRTGGDLSKLRAPQVAPHAKELPPLVRAALQQSAHRGLFTATLDQAALSYQSRAEATSDWTAQYVPGMLTVGVAGTITAAYTIALMWPYTSMLRALADALWR
ncbi:MAG: type II secretion system F family protein [Aeoliella sp.]